MDNKPIINSIDVSECGYYNKDNEPFCCEIWDNECEAQDCYFKQSKRLKQQIEAYQLSENEAKEFIAELKHKNKRLQEENKELKQEKYEIEEKFLNLNCKSYSYYKALEEIRDIAQIHQYFNPELLEIKGDIGQMQDLKMTEIFKKCNEVLK